MRPNILLVNPPIYDFAAHDFWLKPYGMLRVAGWLRQRADLHLFDYLDRWHPAASAHVQNRSDGWDRGPFDAETLPTPPMFKDIPRRYKRYGLPRTVFQRVLAESDPFDVALIQTVMTYWYPGVREVIDDIRRVSPRTKIILGGVYATLCPQHAERLGADLVIRHTEFDPLWRLLGIFPDYTQPPLWEAYARLPVGVMKLADGCPFRCTYCSVPHVYPSFAARPLAQAYAQLAQLQTLGVRNLALYDDALLFKPEQILLPFLDHVQHVGMTCNLHTPNALNARFLSQPIATRMVRAGFKTFYVGFESSAYAWQRRTGGKVYSDELARATGHLVDAGAGLDQITAYLILGHPEAEQQEVEASMHYAHSLGLRLMLSEFSPVPGTPDGERCRAWIDLDEPLWHNKTVFPIRFLGWDEVQRLKHLCRELNAALRRTVAGATVET
jgi:radical SAM superfamily enzyme YgiQ (UPF0313 family)